MGALAPAVSSASDINPYPRAALTTEKLVTWTFAADTAGWTAAHDCRVTAEGGALKITSTGDDPYLIGPAVRVACPLAVSIRIKADGGGPGQFFWTTAEAPNFGPDKVATFPLKHDNQWHEYTVPLSASGTFTRLRLDPGSAPGQIEVASIRWRSSASSRPPAKCGPTCATTPPTRPRSPSPAGRTRSRAARPCA
jgi:hypothetical protein